MEHPSSIRSPADGLGAMIDAEALLPTLALDLTEPMTASR